MYFEKTQYLQLGKVTLSRYIAIFGVNATSSKYDGKAEYGSISASHE
jgi:hypothetical protein